MEHWIYIYDYDKIFINNQILVLMLLMLVRFYGISNFVGYLMPNPFLCKYYSKKFSLVWVHSLSVRNKVVRDERDRNIYSEKVSNTVVT